MNKKLFVIMMVLLMPLCFGCGSKVSEESAEEQQKVQEQSEMDDKNKETTPSINPTREVEKYVFPVALDSEKLELGSVFGYTGMNPDCEDVYAEEVGAIQIKNISGTYLKSAKLQVTLSNGDAFTFFVEDVPVDMEVLAFDVQNQVYNDLYRVEDIQVQSEYEEDDAQEEISVSISGSEITVENISNETLNNITLYYHCTIDGLGYGGGSYEQTIESLQPGEQEMVYDSYCFVGDVTVVRVTHE